MLQGPPTAMSAIIVLFLGIAESVAALYPFFLWLTWKKAIIAGLILKWASLTVCIYLLENSMPSCVCSASLPFHNWVRAHRMARDMIVSLIVVLPQLLLVLFVAINEHVCPGCSAHQLLIYRDPGAVERQEKVFEVDVEEGEVGMFESPSALSMATTSRASGS